MAAHDKSFASTSAAKPRILSELEFLRELTKRQKRIIDSTKKQNTDLKQLLQRCQMREEANVETLFDARKQKRNIEEVEWDERVFSKEIDVAKAVLIGWKSPPMSVWRERMNEAKELITEDPEVDLFDLDNAPQSQLELCDPPLIPDMNEARMFAFGARDVFTCNIYGRNDAQSVFRCCPNLKRYVRLRPVVTAYNKYTEHINDREMRLDPMMDRHFFNKYYAL